MNIPAIIIAGTNSGCGKTSVSMGIMAALTEMGHIVQPYKVGPDYIDPMFHTFITGRESRNLDSWLLDEKTVRHLFQKNAGDADIAVVEGVMGLYDGYGAKSTLGSTAHVSEILEAPVILVINGEAMGLSAAALVKGYAEFTAGTRVKGVIVNNISGGRAHYELIKDAIETFTGITVLGYLPRMSGAALESRHLGLVTSSEITDLREKAGMLSRQIRKTVDMERLVEIARSRGADSSKAGVTEGKGAAGDCAGVRLIEKAKAAGTRMKVRIAVAKDKAFCFYYRDNLDLLEALGVELVYFSPLNDTGLPRDIDGLYLGGGYPEIWAEELQNNTSMKDDIKSLIESGLPAYAECGGLMYLCESITDKEGRKFDMVGLLPGRSHMTDRLCRFGYVNVTLKEDTILAPKGSEIRAHEFHFSETDMDEAEAVKQCFEVSKGRSGEWMSWNCGYRIHNLLAGYAHMHFWANPGFAAGFVESCAGHRKKRCFK